MGGMVMTSPAERTSNAEPEVIGKYRVHPVASVFPLMDDDHFNELVESIEVQGQIVPIVVMGDVLLDGRNRLRACLSLKIPPVIQEYKGSKIPGEYIFALNYSRRDLNDDQRVTITMQAIPLIREETAKCKGGRGNKVAAPAISLNFSIEEPKVKADKPTTEPSSVSQRAKTADRDARSTVGRVAKQAQVSYHKARQVVEVQKHAPELAAEIISGKMPLREAAKVAEQRKPNPKPAPGIEDELKQLERSVARLFLKYPKDAARIKKWLSTLVEMGGSSAVVDSIRPGKV